MVVLFGLVLDVPWLRAGVPAETEDGGTVCPRREGCMGCQHEADGAALAQLLGRSRTPAQNQGLVCIWPLGSRMSWGPVAPWGRVLSLGHGP